MEKQKTSENEKGDGVLSSILSMLKIKEKPLDVEKYNPVDNAIKMFGKSRRIGEYDILNMEDANLTTEERCKKYMIMDCGDYYPGLDFMFYEHLGCEYAVGNGNYGDNSNKWYRKDGRLAYLGVYAHNSQYFVTIDYDGENQRHMDGADIMGRDENGCFMECVGEKGREAAIGVILDYVIHGIFPLMSQEKQSVSQQR